MLTSLPDRVQPYRLAETDTLIEGGVCLAKLPRLASALATPEGNAHGRVRFSLTEGRHRVASVVRADVTLVCERCRDTLVATLSSATELTLVRSDAEAARLDSTLEPWVVEGECASLHGLLEDELLLALPIVPMHEHGACQVAAVAESDSRSEVAATQAHPFATLKDLLSRSLS